MATDIRVPALGESVTEATIGQWFKKVGDVVAADEPVVELETDKVTIEVPAPAAGILEAISANAGDTVNVGSLIGAIGQGASAPAAAPAAKVAEPASAPAPVAAAPAAAPAPAVNGNGSGNGATPPPPPRVTAAGRRRAIRAVPRLTSCAGLRIPADRDAAVRHRLTRFVFSRQLAVTAG